MSAPGNGAPAQPEPTAGTAAEPRRSALRDWLAAAARGENSAFLILAMLSIVAVFAFLLQDTAYLSVDNFVNIIRQTAVVSVLAIATVFVISAGELDLSIAAVIPISAYALALLLPDYGIVVAVAVALASGALIGLVNGLITVKLEVPSFVVTLGMLGFLQGFARVPTKSQAVVVSDPSFTWLFGSGSIGPLSVLVIWTAVATLVGYIVLSWTSIGKAVLATGANVNAARFSGIRTDNVKIGVMVASGVAGALGGLLYVGQFHGARFDLGSTDLLTVIAAAIIGGTALSGGRGSVIGALVGSLLLGAVNNGLIILGLDVPQQLMFRGGIIIAAVVLSARARRRG